MKRAIAEAYSLCIDFAQEVTLYYSRSTWRRVLEAITKPPQLGIDTKIAAITDAMTEIKTERATLDSKRLHQLQQSVDELHQSVDEVHRNVTSTIGAVEGRLECVQVTSNVSANRLQALHVQNESRLLSILKEQLLPRAYDPNSVLEKYSPLVIDSFRNPGRLTVLNVDRLMRNGSFRKWEETTKASMMLLYGRTGIPARERIKGQADRFLDPLINMIKRSKCVIKVFLVASSNNHAHPDGKITSEVLTNAEDELGSDRFWGLNLDQK